jgi:hypothetical protein
MDLEDIFTIDRNHMDMAKFASAKMWGYPDFKGVLEAWLQKAAERAPVDQRHESRQREGERIGA